MAIMTAALLMQKPQTRKGWKNFSSHISPDVNAFPLNPRNLRNLRLKSESEEFFNRGLRGFTRIK
jgi:hypothetical protein